MKVKKKQHVNEGIRKNERVSEWSERGTTAWTFSWL